METSALAASAQGWSTLPADLLLIAMSSMEVPDIVRSGAVCTSSHAAYAAFCDLRLPTPWQAPCLLYYAGTGRATLYSPSGNATFRVPLLDEPSFVICSAHGWLLVADGAANPSLLSPLTDARAALLPITTLDRVRGSFVDESGGVVYDVDYSLSPGRTPPETRQVTARWARDWMYHQAAFSGSPLAAAAKCVVLLVHMPYKELSFAKPGDDRWASLSNLPPIDRHRGYFDSVLYSDKDGLFYALRTTGSVPVLDLNRRPSPAAWLFACTLDSYSSKCTPYLVPAPFGGLLVVTRRWCRSGESPANRDRRCSRDGDKYVTTIDIQIHRIDTVRFRMEKLQAGPRDCALFLGRNSALYLPVERLPAPLSKRDCAYLTDVHSDTFLSPMRRRDIGVWDFASGTMEKLSNVWPLHPWLDCPPPIWITPSLC